MIRLHFFYALLLSSCLCLTPVFAEQEKTDIANDKISNTTQQLNDLITSIEGVQKELAEVKVTLSKTKDELDVKALTQQRDKLSARAQDLQKNFESIAIGGVDLNAFEKNAPTATFDWQEELKEVFRPILDELKRLTERPRTIEKLRTEKTFLSSRLPIADTALERIRHLKKNTTDKQLLTHLNKLEQNWTKRRDDIANQLRLVTFQLEEKLNPSEENTTSISEQINNFLSGRGLNIIFAVVAFFGVYGLFKLLGRLIVRFIDTSQDKEARIYEKAIQIAFRVLAITIAIFSVIIVFYVQGDWILLGLSLLFLIGFAWTLRQSAPRFITEAKLLLNLGPVRENERVVYNGLPWRVTSLNFYTTLTNPALAGGILNLPTHIVLELQSRRFAKDEPWFPSRPGDIMMLDDGYIGPVLMQTPEIVTMKVRGGNTKTYATLDFLGQNPRNLSHGFGIYVTFGFDYNDQAIITTEIPRLLLEHIRSSIQDQVYAEHLKELNVEFQEAAASSLNLLIISSFEGKAAEYYFTITRFLQRASVDACNLHGWNIPFNQITVHMADNQVDS